MIILALLESIGYLLWILTFVGLIAFAIFEGRGVYTKHTIAFRGVKNDLYKAISVTFVIWIVFFVISLFSYRIDYIGLIYLFSLLLVGLKQRNRLPQLTWLIGFINTLGNLGFLFLISIFVALAWILKFVSGKSINILSFLLNEIKQYREYRSTLQKDEPTVTIHPPEELDEGKN